MRETDPLLDTKMTTNNAAKTSDDAVMPESVWHLVWHGVRLQHQGSVARDHLANERTYLAYIRTALAITGVGLGLIKWDDIDDLVGYLVLLLGIFVLLNATQRYFHVMYRLVHHDEFEPNVRSLLSMVLVILLIVAALLVISVHKHL